MTHTVRDVMTTPVVTVQPDTPFKQVVARVRAVGTVPVTDDSGLVRGIVCEHDLLAKTVRQGRPAGRLAAMVRRGGRQAAATSAAGVMTSPAVTTRAGVTTSEAARLMYRHRLGSLPVVDWLGRLVGIISQGDVLDSFTREDTDIRREVIRDIIARRFLLDPQAFRVTVQEGIVTLSGRPENDQVGRLLAATVRRVEGVVSFRDQMQYSVSSITECPLLLPQVPWLSRATAALTLAFR